MRAIYEKKQLEVRDNGYGFYKFADWLPVKRILKGFEMVEPGIARHGYPVFLDGAEIGPVTSGSPAPFLKKNIGLAFLPVERSADGTEIAVRVRDRKLKAKVVPTPF